MSGLYESSSKDFTPQTRPPSSSKKTTVIVRPWPRLMNAEIAGDYLGVSRSTILQWHAEGRLREHELPGIRGRARLERIVFEKSQLDRLAGLRPE